MKQQNPFFYSYNAPENQEVMKIRSQYTQQPQTQLEQLKALDAKVKGPAKRFACVFGTVSALVMGAGMSLVMTDIGTVVGLQESLVPGIAVGIVGLALALINYPIYKGILKGRKEKYADQVLALSDEILQQ